MPTEYGGTSSETNVRDVAIPRQATDAMYTSGWIPMMWLSE